MGTFKIAFVIVRVVKSQGFYNVNIKVPYHRGTSHSHFHLLNGHDMYNYTCRVFWAIITQLHIKNAKQKSELS